MKTDLSRIADPSEMRAYWRAPAFALAVALLVTAAVGYAVLREAKRATAAAVYQSLQATATLKALQASQWIDESRDYVKKIADEPRFADALELWLMSGGNDAELRQQLLDYLAQISESTGYVGLGVHSAVDGALLLATGNGSDSPASRQLAIRAASAGEATLEDFHLEAALPAPATRIGFFCAIRPYGATAPVAVLHASIDPFRLLVPMVQDWPGLAGSSEILLMRQEGSDLVFLNRPANRPDIEAMTLVSRLTPVSRTILGGSGALLGNDYRNVPVFAYGLPVASSSWRVVAKMDEQEVYRQINDLAAVTGGSAALLLLLSCLWWATHNRNVLIRHRQRLEGMLLAKRVDYLARYANDCIVLADMDGCIREFNDRCLATYGYGAAEMVGRPLAELLPAAHRDELAGLIDGIARQGRITYETEHCRKDGSLFPVEISACLIDVEGRRCIQSIIRDISERRRHEDERTGHLRRITEISHRVVSVQEQERRLLAGELHDRTGANLAAISLNLKALRGALPATAAQKCQGLLDETGALLTDTILSVRDICSDLRPAILDYAGLIAALQDLAANFTRRTGIPVSVDYDAFNGQFVAEVESLLFRIVQEALTNCAKHAKARRVGIRLATVGDSAILAVADDGQGFVPDALGRPGHEAGLGLLTMRERAEFIGGRFSLKSQPGTGTEVRVELSLAAGPVRSATCVESD